MNINVQVIIASLFSNDHIEWIYFMNLKETTCDVKLLRTYDLLRYVATVIDLDRPLLWSTCILCLMLQN